MKIRLISALALILAVTFTGCVGYYDRDYDHGGYRDYDKDRDRHYEHDRDHDRDHDADRDRDRDRDHDHRDADHDDRGDQRY